MYVFFRQGNSVLIPTLFCPSQEHWGPTQFLCYVYGLLTEHQEEDITLDHKLAYVRTAFYTLLGMRQGSVCELYREKHGSAANNIFMEK